MIKLKNKKLLLGILLCICTALFACGILAISNTKDKGQTITAHASTVTPTIYWGLSGSGNELTLNLSSEVLDDAYKTAYKGGSFSGTDTFSYAPWYYSYKAKIKEVNIVTPIAPQSTARWFLECSKLTTVDMSNLDLSNVTNMESMFQQCYALTSVSFPQTGTVTNPGYLFNYCSGLTSVDVSKLTISSSANVTSFFCDCTSLKEIILSESVAAKIGSTSLFNSKSTWYGEDGTVYTKAPLPAGNYTTYPPHVHDYKLTKTLKAATCTTDGSAEFTCTVTECAKQKTDVIPATGHKPGAVSCTEEQRCTVCNEKLADAGGHTPGPAATCTEPQKCTVCQAQLAAAFGHSKTPHPANAATCTTDGNVAYWSCSNCNKNLDANDNELTTVVVTKTGHSMTSVSGVAVTCTSDGKVAHYHCSNCNFDFSDSAGTTKLDTTVIKSTGHNYVDKVTAPDCENGGYTTHTCSNCGDEYIDTNVPTTGHTWGTPIWQWATNYLTCSAKFTCSTCNKEQTETASVTHTSATASCTVAGDTTYTASVTFDNNTYTDSKVISGQTLPHTWQLLTESVPPDCENDGAGQFECSVCQKQETRAIDKLGHVEVDDAEVPANCTTDGKTAGKHCSRCNKTLDGLTVIPALGHNWTTDWETDTTNHWHECTVCYEKKDDEAHTYDWVITKDPTEDEEGEKEEFCTVCNYANGNKETIAKLVKDPEGNGDVIDLPVLPPNQDYDLEIAVKESDSLYNIPGITKGYKVELFVVDGENRTEYDNNKKVTLMLVIPEGMEDEFTLYCRYGEILERVDPASYTVNGKSVTIRTTLPNEYVFNAPAPEEPASGIPWWVWVIIGLGGATLLTIIIVFIVVAKKKKGDNDGTPVDNGEVLSQLAEQGQKIDELLTRSDDGGFNTPVELDENGNVIFK